jgi:hypothetical protein
VSIIDTLWDEIKVMSTHWDPDFLEEVQAEESPLDPAYPLRGKPLGPARVAGRLVRYALEGPKEFGRIWDRAKEGKATLRDSITAALYGVVPSVGPGFGAGPRMRGIPSVTERVRNRFQSAYENAQKTSGGSFVDISVLRDSLGLKQDKMAALLKKAQSEGHAVMELGEPSVVSDYLKGGMVDGKLLVRLDPEFFSNIGSYIKKSVPDS